MYENYSELYSPNVTITGTELIALVQAKLITPADVRKLLVLDEETDNG